MAQPLAHTRLTAPGASPERWVTVLHGVFGQGRNWTSVLRGAVERRPEWGALLVDLRLHGASQDFQRPHTVEAAAGDVRALLAGLELPGTAVLGHSFGGKVALRLMDDPPAGLEQVWVIDSTPDAKEPSGSAWEMIEVVRGLPQSFAARAEAVSALQEAGYAPGIAQWMAMNLEPGGEGYVWRLDFDALEEILRDFFADDLWAAVESPPPGVEIHFVRAEGGSVISRQAAERIEALEGASGRVHLHRLEGGHWLNADNPEGIVELLAELLP
jgi:esterase